MNELYIVQSIISVKLLIIIILIKDLPIAGVTFKYSPCLHLTYYCNQQCNGIFYIYRA
jgi:hypothetical protein